MEEFADPEETPHPVVHRTAVARRHGVRDGHVQVLGATRRVQQRLQIRSVQHIGAAVDIRLQKRVSAVLDLVSYRRQLSSVNTAIILKTMNHKDGIRFRDEARGAIDF